MIALLWISLFFASAPARAADPATIAALPGDYPDPSVIRVGDEYWSTATSSAWAPEFPILHSHDLAHWEIAGAVFEKRPDWAVGDFWAPEISEHRGKFAVYYAAKKRGGGMCVAVATADHPQGPYTDHGPLVCEGVGSIDPAPVTDEKGEIYLVWKHDGNSVNQPTPILAQKLTEDGLALVGPRFELIRNDASWEGPLVEGPYVLRHDGWFYLFYSGATCCTRECNYAVGVARARALAGPWEKDPRNPILAGNETWKCPGHGSVVSDPTGRHFYMYHAMGAKDSVDVGRQPLIDEIRWGSRDSWPTINEGHGPSNSPSYSLDPAERAAMRKFDDSFATPNLVPGWQWPQDNEPAFQMDGKALVLGPNADRAGADDLTAAVLARRTLSASYFAETKLDPRSLGANGRAGLAVYGDADNSVGISVGGGKIFTWRRTKGVQAIGDSTTLPAEAMSAIFLKAVASQGEGVRFSYRPAGAKAWARVGAAMSTHDLPPWDLGLRVALAVAGSAHGPAMPARFELLRIAPNE